MPRLTEHSKEVNRVSCGILSYLSYLIYPRSARSRAVSLPVALFLCCLCVAPAVCGAVHSASVMYDSPAERALLSTPLRSEPDPEDHPLTKVRWDNPVVSSTCVLPPHESADRKALFYSRDEEMSNRASVVLEASLVRCVGALILWGVACYALALATRCLMYGKCQVLTPPPSFPE